MFKDLPRFITTSSQKGFTLLELVVVLAILGTLAAALVATINPAEQVNQTYDTSLKNLSTQFIQASVRYYSTRNAFPWSSQASGGAGCYSGSTTLDSVALSNLDTCITTLVSDGELKQSFAVSDKLDSVVVTNPNPQTGNASDVIVCFQPKSTAQQKDANTRYNQNGSLASSCKAQGGQNSCYWCTQ